jgi:DNA-binding MarR family transcriptional regulator
MDFYDRIGTASLGSRLRRLGDRLAEDAKPIYAMYGMQLQPRWFPVIYLLANEGKHSVTAIADEIGQTHASVSQIVGEMVKQDYARLSKGTSDGRKTFVSLSAKGLGAARKLNPQLIDAAAAVEDMQAEVGVDLWNTLVAIEQALDRQNLHRRLLRQKIKREGNVTIVDYLPRHAKAFRTLNEDWINTYFKMEEADRRALNDPEGTFLQPGGFILMAVSGSKPVGACALLPHGEGCFELAKSARPVARARASCISKAIPASSRPSGSIESSASPRLQTRHRRLTSAVTSRWSWRSFKAYRRISSASTYTRPMGGPDTGGCTVSVNVCVPLVSAGELYTTAPNFHGAPGRLGS